MAEESQALAKFYDGFEQDGVSEDGLPRFRDKLMILLDVPPFTQLTRAAAEEDFETYPGPWKLYEKEHAARKAAAVEGYPLVLWPAVGKAELQMLSARDIITVEQLAKYAERGGGAEKMPGELRELAQRAKQMMELSKELGQFEVKIRDRDGQIEVLKEQVADLRATVKSQEGQINALRQKAA
jgi:hypothetical protein